MLELRHVAREYIIRVIEGVGVFSFPNRAASLDISIEGAASPRVVLRDHLLAYARDLQAGLSLIPLPVEFFRPASEHDRKDAGEIFGR